MDRTLSAPWALPLSRDRVVGFHAARGTTIACRRGELWVTQDGDLRDVVLRAGERVTLDRPGRVLVSALRDATLDVQPPPRAAPRHLAAALEGLRQWPWQQAWQRLWRQGPAQASSRTVQSSAPFGGAGVLAPPAERCPST